MEGIKPKPLGNLSSRYALLCFLCNRPTVFVLRGRPLLVTMSLDALSWHSSPDIVLILEDLGLKASIHVTFTHDLPDDVYIAQHKNSAPGRILSYACLAPVLGQDRNFDIAAPFMLFGYDNYRISTEQGCSAPEGDRNLPFPDPMFVLTKTLEYQQTFTGKKRDVVLTALQRMYDSSWEHAKGLPRDMPLEEKISIGGAEGNALGMPLGRISAVSISMLVLAGGLLHGRFVATKTLVVVGTVLIFFIVCYLSDLWGSAKETETVMEDPGDDDATSTATATMEGEE